MKQTFPKIKEFLLDVFFPRYCLGCGKEGTYLCNDCRALIEVLEYQFCPWCGKKVPPGRTCQKCRNKTRLDGLYCATPYQNIIVKKLIHQFKYKPFIKELAKPTASLIIAHFLVLGNKRIEFLQPAKKSRFQLVPVPLYKKRLKWRGFNQAQQIAIYLSQFLHIPIVDNVLVRNRKTPPQTQIKNKDQRRKNIQGAFACNHKNPQALKGKKVLLVDDVYTTGATMAECANVLKRAGAEEVWGVVVARD